MKGCMMNAMPSLVFARIGVPLMLGAVVLGVAAGARALPAESDHKERIEELEIDAKGESGLIRTSPMYLDDAPGEYHFGSRWCGKGHRLGAATLGLLQAALAAGQPVRIEAERRESKGVGRECVTGVVVFAP